MSIRFFGQFLLEKGLVTPEQLKQALKIQSEKRQYFGTYALRLGYIDVTNLNELLRIQQRTGKRIGELAIEKGFLSASEVEEILMRQKNDHLFVGEILVSTGIMKRENLYSHLDAFHREMKKLDTIVLPEDMPCSPVFHQLFQIFGIFLARYLKSPVKILNNGTKGSLDYSTATAAVRCTHRENPFRIIFTVDDALSVPVMSGYIGKENVEPDEKLRRDVLEEILNIAAGNFLTYAQQSGHVWELEPPIILDPAKPILPLYGNSMIEIVLATPHGDASLGLDEGGNNG